ncbi:hypothetical protein [Solimonas sp. SE-A11]|uniref:hypothetical protein n=1 Tax=Solimonas sp. SE-A11 TaxID=3054954 RepID=UPI00259CD347|nr:hypothetical protein [Solimonas sp. SE-A11]MDM4772472.1 hypothetical protein [Solimonas sp. SE-A11]
MRAHCPACRERGLAPFSLAISSRYGAARCSRCGRGFFVRHYWRLAALVLMVAPLYLALKLHLGRHLLLDSLLILAGYFMATRMIVRWAEPIPVASRDAARLDRYGKLLSAAILVGLVALVALLRSNEG